jgi:chromosome segregation ATPase
MAIAANKQVLVRLDLLERDTERLKDSLSKIELSHNLINTNLAQFQAQLGKLTDLVEKIRIVEGELRELSDKLLTYETKFKTIQEIKTLVIAGIVTSMTVVPALIGAVIALYNFMHGAH